MSELISGKEALIALANGEIVHYRDGTGVWCVVENDMDLSNFLDEAAHNWMRFRLKPRIITLNGIEVPAPFKPKSGDMVWCLNELSEKGYEARTAYESDDFIAHIAYWQTEEKIKQVVAALHTIFK